MTNIVLISVDDLNNWTSALGGYGGVIHTPNIDRIAAEATTFANAYATAPGCNQSRTATLSGMSPLTTGVLTNNQYAFDYVDPSQTLPALLREAGYETATAGKVFHDLPEDISPQLYDTDISPADPENALDKEEAFVDRTVENWEAGVFTGDPERLTDAITTNAVAEFLAGYAPQPGKEGLFLSVGLSRPHNPWYVPQEYFDLYPLDEIVVPDLRDNDLSDVPAFAQTFTDERQVDKIIDEGEYRAFVQGYLAAVSFADAMIGRLLDAIEASAIAGDTKIVLWSDHGFHLGEKDNIGKFTLWEQAARAQFMVWDPDAPTGEVRDEAVSLLDLMPTVLDYAGVAAPAHAEGQSLRPLIETGEQDDLRGYAVTLIRGSYSLRTDAWRYTRYEDGSEELYDEVNDPDEYDNLAGDPAYVAIKAELAATLDDYIEDGLVVQSYDDAPRRLVADGERTLIGGYGADTLVGGDADNVYVVRNEDQRVVEARNGGIDTVLARDSFVLPKNVENLSAENRDGPTEGPNERSYVGNKLDNVISVNFGQATVQALAGDDTLNGGQGEDALHGGTGDDSVKADDGDDTIDGGAGDDSLQGGKDDDLYILSDGADTISERRDQGDDTIDISAWGFENLQITQVRNGGSGPINALALTNWLTGEQTLLEAVQGRIEVEFLTDGVETRRLLPRGAPAADGGETLFGSAASDTIQGTSASDLLRGGAAADTLFGNDGDDVLEGGTGDDLLNGNAGRDAADYALASGAIAVDLAAGTATGAAGTDTLREIEDVTGGDFADLLTGSGLTNRLVGGRGNDCIAGASGDDTLQGEAGRDTLAGGAGNDVLLGGGMADLFVFASAGDGADTIGDWDDMDRIDVSAIDADPGTGPDNAFAFVGSAAFTAAAQLRVVQVGGQTRVELNTDVDGAAELTITLGGLRALTAADFVL